MAFESPLFQSSVELLGHSIEHFVALDELDRKLVILHLANSVELLLKDLMLDGGLSIYKNPKETVTIISAIEAVKGLGIIIPSLNKIELLIDERNSLQHRFGSPNEITTIYHMDSTMGFFEQILEKQYSLKLEEILPQFTKPVALTSFKARTPTNGSELEKLMTVGSLHPLGAFLAAYAYLDRVVRDLTDQITWPDVRTRRDVTLNPGRALYMLGIEVPDTLMDQLTDLRYMRNSATHGGATVSQDDVKFAISTIEEIEKLIRAVDVSDLNEFVAKKYGQQQKLDIDEFVLGEPSVGLKQPISTA